MIFVTVGTHEQGFERLIKEIEKLKLDKTIDEEVIIQEGYTKYEPKECKVYKLIAYDDMIKYMNEARIIITHGGPASFMMPLSINKIPIVVPRQKKYNEHVNNHQVEFVKQVYQRYKNIIPIYDIKDLKDNISGYNEIVKNMNIEKVSNNKYFCERLDKELRKIFED